MLPVTVPIEEEIIVVPQSDFSQYLLCQYDYVNE
jgi:hypothetical protein